MKTVLTPQEAARLRDVLLATGAPQDNLDKYIAGQVTSDQVLDDNGVPDDGWDFVVWTANGRSIVSVDHMARNGVIHIVNEVMSSVYKRQGSVVSEIDECCPQHSLLLELIKEAKLFDVLDLKGPFTFFAPLNG